MKQLLTFGAASCALIAGAFQTEVRIESRRVSFDASPTYRGSTLMVPLRDMVLAMNGTYRLDMAKETLTCWARGRKFAVVLNSRMSRVDDRETVMDGAAFIHRGRFYAPLKWLADAAGYQISDEGGAYVLRSRHGA